uniref:Aminotran_1_2 domain-containing protein n=1 Tax=Macrostomum lignano TaxID=282301 RepID=A0A1I8JQF0_9PLAT
TESCERYRWENLCLPEGAENPTDPPPTFKEASIRVRDNGTARDESQWLTLAESLGIEARSYNLLADRQWEVDLAHLEESIDDRTAAIVVNNRVQSLREHLRAIAHIAERGTRCQSIADEIYPIFVFPGHEFHWFASVNPNVPVLSCGGLTKRWLVPGWRQGWIVVYDAKGHFGEVRKGLLALSTRILGLTPSAQISCAAIPDILEFTPPEFYASTLKCIEENAKLSYAKLSAVPDSASDAEGAMYMMVGFSQSEYPDFPDEMAFTERLVTEQSVFCLPFSLPSIDPHNALAKPCAMGSASSGSCSFTISLAKGAQRGPEAVGQRSSDAAAFGQSIAERLCRAQAVGQGAPAPAGNTLGPKTIPSPYLITAHAQSLLNQVTTAVDAGLRSPVAIVRTAAAASSVSSISFGTKLHFFSTPIIGNQKAARASIVSGCRSRESWQQEASNPNDVFSTSLAAIDAL